MRETRHRIRERHRAGEVRDGEGWRPIDQIRGRLDHADFPRRAVEGELQLARREAGRPQPDGGHAASSLMYLSAMPLILAVSFGPVK